MSSRVDTECRRAISHSESPGRTTIVTGPAPLPAAPADPVPVDRPVAGISNSCPICRRRGFTLPFAARSAANDTPYRCAITPSVCPRWTVTTVVPSAFVRAVIGRALELRAIDAPEARADRGTTSCWPICSRRGFTLPFAARSAATDTPYCCPIHPSV